MREKVEASGLERAFIMFGWELAGRTWADKVAVLVALAQHRGHDILFVDNTSRAAQIEDEGGVEFARAVEKLQEACRTAGLTLIIDVHHKKGRDSIENKTRGGTGVQGAVDINVEVERVGGHSSRKRRLTAFGRVRATNWLKVIELSADGREYALATDDHTEVDEETQIAFMDAELLRKLGRVEVLDFAAQIKRSRSTAQRRLDVLAAEGLAVKHKGTSPKEPTVYEAVAVQHHAP